MRGANELTFLLAYHTQGGLTAEYVDSLPIKEALWYVERLAKQRRKENEAIKRG